VFRFGFGLLILTLMLLYLLFSCFEVGFGEVILV